MGVLLVDPITEEDSFIEEIVPEGWYDVQVIKSGQDVIESNGKGVLRITIKILNGKYKGLIKNLSFWIYEGNSDKAISYSRAMLFRLGRACGLNKIKNTDELHGKSFCLKFKEGIYKDKATNDMVGFQPYVGTHEGAEQEQPKTNTAQSTPAPAAQQKQSTLELPEDEIPF